MLSKASYIAKNVIYLKNFSVKKEIIEENTRPVLLSYPKRLNIDFYVDRFHLRVLRGNDPLVKAAQKLRFRSFFKQRLNSNQSDSDEFDKFCDHLVVIDTSISKEFVVGTYRLLLDNGNHSNIKLYTETEFDLKRLRKKNIRILEAGRSCVDEDYRDKGIIRILWKGLSKYIIKQNIKFITGCASFPYDNYSLLNKQLSYLHHYHLAPKKYRSFALENKKAHWKLLPKNSFEKKEIFKTLPPLIKAYLRVGSWIGDGAIIDEEFKTIDVCIILKKENILNKYLTMSVKK